MFKFISNTITKYFICFAIICFFCSSESIAQQGIKVAGKMTCAGIDNKVFDIGYPEGQRFSITEAEGFNVSTGSNPFMDGAQVTNISFADLVKGNGPYQGYIKLKKKDDVVYCKWEGNIKTIISEEKTPVTTFEGKYYNYHGSGAFKNIQGKGTFKGKFVSNTIFIVEWEGDYFIK